MQPALTASAEAQVEPFSAEELEVVHSRQRILSSLAYFIGKDFEVPVKLSKPGEGWCWNFKTNVIYADPKDLLERSMNYLRYVISHEGAHRRISRAEVIPREEWEEPGFAMLSNAIEDPRVNNFTAECYPKFREYMMAAFQERTELEGKMDEKAKVELGYVPRFVRAGLEYIRRWQKEEQGIIEQEPCGTGDEVMAVVDATIEHAANSWWTYPSRAEADASEDEIQTYALASHLINRDRIWPEFKKLVDKDMDDQRLQEFLKQLMKERMRNSLPPELAKKLSTEELTELLQAMDKAVKEGRAMDLDSLSEALKQKIKKYIDSLTDGQKAALLAQAIQAIREFENRLIEEMEGDLSGQFDPESEAAAQGQAGGPVQSDGKAVKNDAMAGERPGHGIGASGQALKEQFQKIQGNLTDYEKARLEVIPIIDRLEQDLREIFVDRRSRKLETGFKTGKRISIKKRIQEKARKTHAMDSRAWQRREIPQEKDYAITLLVDLSGSMYGEKISETHKAVIVLAEVLNRLSIRTEILGFNSFLYEYQNYGETFGTEVREKLHKMPNRVYGSAASYNDDGWAVKKASARLAKERAQEKFLIVLSDGYPAPAYEHEGPEYDLKRVVSEIGQDTDQKLVGLGIGPDTEHVEEYYPNSLANVNTEQMGEELAGLVRDVIENYQTY